MRLISVFAKMISNHCQHHHHHEGKNANKDFDTCSVNARMILMYAQNASNTFHTIEKYNNPLTIASRLVSYPLDYGTCVFKESFGQK